MLLGDLGGFSCVTFSPLPGLARPHVLFSSCLWGVPRIFNSNLTNEYWAMHNHHHNQFTAHLSRIACMAFLSMLWIVACVRASWHVGLTAYKMRQDLTATGNIVCDEEKESANAAVDGSTNCTDARKAKMHAHLCVLYLPKMQSMALHHVRHGHDLHECMHASGL